ncbi:uncharacterized protein LOC116350753 [Contarinia nasturtii]|uniref:uncharacterized protein LOC116350753 n=1 Tax=Contarinia nasturtii TaxID=265458 RepID=UPI0012D41AE5|nr:uncharacterized protein LOC116350753 [Contarinia nasturtii]
MNFKNKVVVVTGSSSGIGADAAVYLAQMGADVVLVGRNEMRLNDVKNQIISNGSSTPLVIVADVTRDCEKIISKTVEHFGKINVLINNAGILTEDNIENITMEAFDKMIDTNLRSVIQLTQKAIPFLEQTKGNILNVSSTAGMKAVANLMSYCISKASLDQFTKCVALDLASRNIRCNAINPAAIRTPIYRTLGIDSEEEQAIFNTYQSRYPLGRIGEVSDTSAAIAYLTSDAASFITGTLLNVDGGALVAGFD